MKMNLKVIAMTAMMLVGSLTASAKWGDDVAPFHFGFRAGVSFSELNYSNADVLTAPYGGLAFDFKIAKVPVYLETGMYYMNMGTKYDDFWNDGKATCDNNSLMVPLVGSYHFRVGRDMTIQPFSGMYVSYGFDYDKADFGLREGVGFTAGKFYANIGANYGLVEQDGDAEHCSLFLTVGFNFIGDK